MTGGPGYPRGRRPRTCTRPGCGRIVPDDALRAKGRRYYCADRPECRLAFLEAVGKVPSGTLAAYMERMVTRD
jgi:hypothetical protein